nr:hypothetical protein [Tanacetum cinerariifolium]
LRRNGRVKSKGPVVEKNTVSDAYSVDDESSGNNFVDRFGKGVEVGKRVVKRGSGSNVSDSNDDKGKNDTERNSGAVKKRKKSDMIACLVRIGFTSLLDFKVDGIPSKLGFYVVDNFNEHKMEIKLNDSLLDFKVDGIPSKLGFYVVDNFNEHKMEIKLNDRSIIITKQMIGEMLGIRNDGLDIMAQEDANDDEMLKDWDAQFNKGNDITPSYLKFLIRKSKVVDMKFKLNLIVLFTSIMGSVKPKGICDLSVLHNISRKTDLAKINWCEYMLYVDGTVCNEFNVGQKRPPTSFWTMELLKEREHEEINSGGIGKGELQGLFVEEEDDQMPEDEDKEVLTMVDKVVEEFESSKKGNVKSSTKGNDFEPPSFNFGVTQDFEMMLSLETPVIDRNTPVLRYAHHLESIKAMPLTERSPFMSRVIDINAMESKDKKRVENFLMNKIRIDQSVVLFESAIGTKASRKWSCGLETEGRKQNTLLGRLRKKYAATLLLLECNMHRDSVCV